MNPLAPELRKQLAKTVLLARDAAEAGARKALQALAVHEPEPYQHLSEPQRLLRRALRAQARQLGDEESRAKKGTYDLRHLQEKVAYDQWHRLLFARFLLDNNLLISPEHGVAVSLADCEELAPSLGLRDGWTVAARFAAAELPEIFRADDPAGQIELPIEDRKQLVQLVTDLPVDVFVADDSLGWVYQFWQAKRKDEVNESGVKIGADELPAVTQLFTEDYMVLFLLHNTLGAWWAGKMAKADPERFRVATEEEARKAAALSGIDWTYLRFVKNESGEWYPAAGTFDGWPKAAKDVRVLDPCMGSGHFLVAELPILVAMRMAEEGLLKEEAVVATLRDNLFGLEIDPRCSQIAAFNLAQAAWKLGGWQKVPQLNLACSGLGPNAKKEDWLKLAGGNEKLQNGIERLYRLFKDAPVLGSLINPRTAEGDLLEAAFHQLQPLLEKALAQETEDDTAHEMTVTARGLARAAEILAGQFTLVATNVPYLGRGNQDNVLKDYCERVHPDAKNDLATCFMERCLGFCTRDGSVSSVTPQNWFSQPRYERLRSRLLMRYRWNGVARLGAGAFETIGGEVVTVSLVMLSNTHPPEESLFMALDVSDQPTAATKAAGLLRECIAAISQASQLKNPDAIITLDSAGGKKLLSELARAWQGLVTGDDNRFYGYFWERPRLDGGVWSPVQQAPQESLPFTGRETVVRWENARGDLHLASKAHNFPPPSALSKSGIAIQRMVSLNATIYSGEVFDDSVAPLIPENPANLPAIYAFCLSDEFKEAVRRINHQPKVIPGALAKVPFDLAHWQKVAAEKYPHGLPKPFSNDPAQWLFNGHPNGSDQPLQVAVARLLGYQWPRQTGSSFPDCPTLGQDGLGKCVDGDGIVCISAIKGEAPAAERLRALLAEAYGSEWSATKQAELLAQVDYTGSSLDDWLRHGFFEEHCALFHHRPFIWHIWDGRKDGFSALANYHRLDKANLEKLTYTYLGDWIARQQAAVAAGEAGSDARSQAAKTLQGELKKILEGEPPYDLFIRWKSIEQQPIGWEPHLNDGVRLNIRPFMSAKDVGKKGAGILRSRPNIHWKKDRGTDVPSAPWFKVFKGERVNDYHLTLEEKRKACAAAK